MDGRRRCKRRQLGLAAGQGRASAVLPGVGLALLVVWWVGPPAAHAGEGFAMLGAGGSSKALHGYVGVVYAPGASLSDSGPLVRAWAKTFGFSYETDLPGRRDVAIEAVGYGVEADAGWQIAGRRGRAALFAGAAWRDHKLSPSDPGSRLERGRLGLSLAADGELRLSDRFGIMANGNYVFRLDQYWAQTRPFVDLGHGWKAGFDLAGHGGPDYATVRAGLFTSGYELPVTAFGRMFVGAEAGAQYDVSGGRLSPYLGLNAGVLF